MVKIWKQMKKLMLINIRLIFNLFNKDIVQI